MARGPSFQKGKVVEHFSNLEIYNLLASTSSPVSRCRPCPKATISLFFILLYVANTEYL